MKIDTKQEFVDYVMKKFEKIDKSPSFLFPIGLFEEIADDISYLVGGNSTKKEILDILCGEEYSPNKMITTASYIPRQPTVEEILLHRQRIAEQLYSLYLKNNKPNKN